MARQYIHREDKGQARRLWATYYNRLGSGYKKQLSHEGQVRSLYDNAHTEKTKDRHNHPGLHNMSSHPERDKRQVQLQRATEHGSVHTEKEKQMTNATTMHELPNTTLPTQRISTRHYHQASPALQRDITETMQQGKSITHPYHTNLWGKLD